MPPGGSPPDRRHRAEPGLPRLAALRYETVADAGDAHFLAGRRRRRHREQVAREAVERRGPLLGHALDAGPPHRRQRGGRGEHGQQDERRMNRHQQANRHGEPNDPPARREHRHVHVVEDEHLIPEHREPVEIVRTLLVRNCRHGRLELRHVRLERDRHPVAEPPLEPRAHGAQEPRRRRGDSQRECRDTQQADVPLQQSFADQFEPECEQSIRKGHQQRQRERDEHQPGLEAIAQLAQPPHGR